MTTRFGNVLFATAQWILYGVLFLLPLFFLPTSLDPLEVNKQTLLVIGSLLSLLFWLGSMAVKKEILVRGGWLNLLPILLLGVTAISSWQSQGPYLSWVGSSGQEYLSFASLIGFSILFYLCVNLIGERERESVWTLLVVSSVGVAIGGIVSLLISPAYNTVGTVNALGLYLAAMLVFASAAQAKAKSRGLATLAWILAVVSLFILIVIDYWPVWITLIAGLGTFIAFSMVRPQAVLHPSRFVLPSLLLAAAALFLFALPNPFSVTVPQEVTLNYNTSADIVQKTWNETSPWWGSGPGTFMFRYAQDHGTEVNSTSFWDTRFDRASSHLLTLAASIGKIGLVAWGVFAAAVLGVALLALARKKPERDELVVAPLCAFVAIVAGLCAYTANTTLVFAFFVVSAWVVGCSTSAAWHRSFKQSPAGGLAIGTLFVVSLLAISTGVFLCGQRYVAEAAFAKAVRLDRNGGDVQDILSQVDRAASANRFEDIYYRNLAQALLQKLADEMQNVDDTQKIADDKQQYLLALTSAGVNAAVHATDLSPNQALNWLARGDVYRSLIPLSASAGDQALAAYAKAASLEPSNPSDVTELGKAYLAIAAQEQTLAAGASGEEKTAAENRVQGALQHAEAAFLQAITLKADYGPAHFELALTYEQQGRLDDAVGKMESVAKYNSLDIGVAFQLGLLYVRRGSEGDVERAQEQFEHVVSLAPSYSNARWFLASIYEQEGKIDAAIQQIEAVLSLNPDNEIVKARLERLKSGVLSPEIPPVLTDGQ